MKRLYRKDDFGNEKVNVELIPTEGNVMSFKTETHPGVHFHMIKEESAPGFEYYTVLQGDEKIGAVMGETAESKYISFANSPQVNTSRDAIEAAVMLASEKRK